MRWPGDNIPLQPARVHGPVDSLNFECGIERLRLCIIEVQRGAVDRLRHLFGPDDETAT